MTIQPTTGTATSRPVDPTDARSFRDVLGHVPTGVTLLTGGGSRTPEAAMVVGTFGSVSLDPPLVCFLPDRASTTWPLLRALGSFTASVLAHDQVEVCRAFARKEPDRSTRFGWERSPAAGFVVPGAAAWIDAEITDVHPAGDHDIVLARVVGLGANPEAEHPLVFSRGRYGAPVPL